MGIGKSIQRVDARAKVTGQAKYTQDLMTQPMMVAKVVHSTIANGVVTGFDLDEALKVPGVIKIVTCFDVPEIDFCTPGHPWSVEAAHQDVQDRRLLISGSVIMEMTWQLSLQKMRLQLLRQHDL